MKNILFISFAFLFFLSCDNNPVVSPAVTCDADGCICTDCTCGCVEGGECTCTEVDGCVCGTTCDTDGCSAEGCATDCACGCDGLGGDDCTCSTDCACGADTSTTWDAWYGTNDSFTINVGDIVLWTSTGTHTVTSDDDGVSFSSGTLSAGGTFEHQFDSAGEFPYHCEFHPGSMTGTITVTE